MIWLKLAYKEIRNNPRFSLFFIFNLSLGLVGFIALNSFQGSINQHISNKSRAILSADIDIRSTYALTDEQLSKIESQIDGFLESTRRVDFLSMMAGEGSSRLIQILAIEENYPLYGEIVLGNQGPVSRKQLKEQLIDSNEIWVQPEILTALNLKIGSIVRIGAKSFKISNTIVDTSTGFALSGGFAYRVFMGRNQAEQTGLIDIGSRRSHHYFYTLPSNNDVKATVDKLQKYVAANFGENTYLRVQSHYNAGRRLTRFVGYLNDYLGLVSLVALFLAGVGTAYLFRSYLNANLKDIAILTMLGAEKSKAYLFLIIQLVFLGTISAVFSFLLSFLFLPLLNLLMEDFLPKGFVTVFSWQSVFLAFFMGIAGSILFCLPILRKIYTLKPMMVFNEDLRSSTSKSGFGFFHMLTYIPLLLTFWLLSVWQSQSMIIGSLFIVSLLGAFVILGILAWAFIQTAKRISPQKHLVLKLAFRNLFRNKIAVISSFLAIGLGTLLINLIPQIDYGLQQEIDRPESSNLPSLFLFDIQSNQIKPLEELLFENGYAMETIAPWVESRLSHIKGVAVKEIELPKGEFRENRRGRWIRRRTQNLSYRADLYSSESIVEGKPFSGSYNFESNELPEISLEVRYAESLEVQVGDTLTFDVQGIPIQGKIVNIRRIQWQTMQPNFYVIFQPGVLEDAPSTFLATIYQVNPEDKIGLQNKVVKAFPNISMVDITMAVNKILEITNQISWAIQVMAFLAVFVGMIVVYSISRYNSQSRMKEINLLKILGASFGDIRKIIVLEFMIFGLVASGFGAFLSLGAFRVLSYAIFERLWPISWSVTFFTILAVTLLTIVSAYLGTRKALLQKPISLLQAV